jgi:putative sigma-54 modulation protein
MYVSIDLVEEIIERQLKKYKNKIVDRHQSGDYFKQEFIEKDYVDEEEVQIVRTKKFDIKPMYAEDACIQMELTGHNFFVFVNAETDQVNVVYKRKGNTYGLIEPEY